MNTTDNKLKKYKPTKKEIDFITKRAEVLNLATPDKIQWIESAWEMIMYARKHLS